MHFSSSQLVLLASVALMALWLAYSAQNQLRSWHARRRLARAGNVPPSASRRMSWGQRMLTAAAVIAGLAYAWARINHPEVAQRISDWFLKSMGVLAALFVGLLLIVWIQSRLSRNRLKHALSLYNAGNREAAIQEVRDLLAATDPKRSPVSYGLYATALTAFLIEAGDLAGAEAVFVAASEAQPRNYTLRLARAQCVAKQGRHEEALGQLEEVSRMLDRDAAIPISSAEILLELGRNEEAAEQLRRAEDLGTAYPEAQGMNPGWKKSIAALRERAGGSTHAFPVIIERAPGG
jgi:tetratricopeptide (TPR) repeat protein